METTVVNLYGGPGTGKSTVASGVFSQLKIAGKSVELVHEFAKDLTWENRQKTLQFQPYVIGKQMYRIWRVLGQVDVIITDSPILLGWHYANEETPPGFFDMVKEYQYMWSSLDIVLKRDLTYHPYDPKGRNQTQEEALAVDKDIEVILNQCDVPYTPVRVNHTTVGCVLQLIYDKMNWEY